jgi:hypothetical protein
MTMALSPAKTKSIKTMASKADHHGEENNSMTKPQTIYTNRPNPSP